MDQYKYLLNFEVLQEGMVPLLSIPFFLSSYQPKPASKSQKPREYILLGPSFLCVVRDHLGLFARGPLVEEVKFLQSISSPALNT